MPQKAILTDKAPSPIGPYSQAIEAGNMVFCSGQIALDAASGKIIGEGDVEAQTKKVMENLGEVLKAANLSFANVVKTGIFVKSMGDFAKVNEIYGSYFSGTTPPARATVEVSCLPKNVLVEIDAIAVKA